MFKLGLRRPIRPRAVHVVAYHREVAKAVKASGAKLLRGGAFKPRPSPYDFQGLVIILGVKFAKAEEPQEREKAKAHLKNAIIGFALIFILLLALNIAMPRLIDWVNGYQTGTTGNIQKM